MLDKTSLLEQKLDCIHQNPVLTGFITEAEYWKSSSSLAYSKDDINYGN